MKSCIFSFYISTNDIAIDELPVKHPFGQYTVQVDAKTPYTAFSDGGKTCAIFGLAVNVITGESENLAEKILLTCDTMEQVVDFEKQLGGKYIILFQNQEDTYILGDATTSIPVFYNTEGDLICTSNFQYILRACPYAPDPAFHEIRRKSDISQAMPYDITPYREIKQLLPNHYLSFTSRAAKRFVNAHAPQPPLPVEDATTLVAPMIETLTEYYKSLYKICCPITAGRDSRVVLAFLMDGKAPVPCYTMKHPEHRDDAQDIVIPQKLCAGQGLPHDLISDITVSDGLIRDADNLLGHAHYSPRTLQIAQTVLEYCGGNAIISGDIIGQVGKCSLHRDIAPCFATAGYFRCKLHNYSRGAKKQLKRWLDDIRKSGESINTFDLFSVENRLGRWAAQTQLVYNSLGQPSLNIFNSRSIVYAWTAVDRKQRKMSHLHVSLIQSRQPSLLQVPFEAEESLVSKLSKSTGSLYLLASYAKYYIERAKFPRKR